MSDVGSSPSCCCCVPIRLGVGILLSLDLLRIAGTSYSNAAFFINATDTQDFYKAKEGTEKKELAAPVLTSGTEADVQWWITVGVCVVNVFELLFVLLAFYAIIAVEPAALRARKTMRRAVLQLPHLVSMVLGTLVYVGTVVWGVLYIGLTTYSLIVVVVAGFFVLLALYFTWVTWLCYAYLKVLVIMEEVGPGPALAVPKSHVAYTPSSQMTNL